MIELSSCPTLPLTPFHPPTPRRTQPGQASQRSGLSKACAAVRDPRPAPPRSCSGPPGPRWSGRRPLTTPTALQRAAGVARNLGPARRGSGSGPNHSPRVNSGRGTRRRRHGRHLGQRSCLVRHWFSKDALRAEVPGKRPGPAGTGCGLRAFGKAFGLSADSSATGAIQSSGGHSDAGRRCCWASLLLGVARRRRRAS